MIGIIVSFMFHSFFEFPSKVQILILFFSFFQFYTVVSQYSKVDNIIIIIIVSPYSCTWFPTLDLSGFVFI